MKIGEWLLVLADSRRLFCGLYLYTRVSALGQRGTRHVYACDFSRYVAIRGAIWRYVAIGRDRSRSGGGARETE